MSRLVPRRPLAGVVLASLAAALAGCATTGPAAGAPPHFATQTVTVTAQGLQPTERVRIPTFGTVVFANALPQGAITVQIARPFAPSANCTTALGFLAMGMASSSQPIPPQGVASLCFHDAGSFAFTVATPAGERRGVIEVGAER